MTRRFIVYIFEMKQNLFYACQKINPNVRWWKWKINQTKILGDDKDKLLLTINIM